MKSKLNGSGLIFLLLFGLFLISSGLLIKILEGVFAFICIKYILGHTTKKAYTKQLSNSKPKIASTIIIPRANRKPRSIS